MPLNNPQNPARSPSGQFQTGSPSANPKGRPRGSRNRVSESVRDEFLQAYREVGGKDYLVRFAREHPKDFIGILGRMLPKEIRHEINNAPLGNAEVLAQMKVEWAASRERETAKLEEVKVIDVETKAE